MHPFALPAPARLGADCRGVVTPHKIEDAGCRRVLIAVFSLTLPIGSILRLSSKVFPRGEFADRAGRVTVCHEMSRAMISALMYHAACTRCYFA